MQKIIRMGDGKIEVATGMIDDIPVLILAPQDKEHREGERATMEGEEISQAELNRRGAVIVEIPEYRGLDVILNAIMVLWQEKKAKEWDNT